MVNKVHIGNLPDNCKAEAVKDLFLKFGEVLDVNVIKNYAFVTMETESAANEAVNTLDKTKLFGKDITVQRAKSQGSNSSSRANRRDSNSNRRNASAPYNRKSNTTQNIAPLMGPQLQQLGGILGAAPLLLNEMTKQIQQEASRDTNKPDPDIRVRREVVHVKNVPNADKYDFNSGYVIHERYYVLPSHPLLNGMNVSQLPTLSETNCARTR